MKTAAECQPCPSNVLMSPSPAGIMSATGNGYVIYMTIKRKTKLRPPELMTVNLAIFDFGISGTAPLSAERPLGLMVCDITVM